MTYTAETIINLFREWATGGTYRPWKGHLTRYAVLDSETTDLDGEVIELAIVAMDGRVLFDERIRPQYPVTPGAQAVHGITTADLFRCQDFMHFWPRIRRIISEYDILVYNAAFDFEAIHNSLSAAFPQWYRGPLTSTDPFSADHWCLSQARRRAACVMEAYAPLAGQWSEYHGSYRWAKLTEACAQRGVDLTDLKPHSALGDAVATARLIRACAQLDPADFPLIGRETQEGDS